MAIGITGAEYGALGVIGEHNTLVDFVHEGIEPQTVEAIGHPPSGRGLLGKLVREAIRMDDVRAHPDFTGFPPHHPEMTSFLGVPVRVGDMVFGNLYLANKPEGFSPDDEGVVQVLAAIAAGAVTAQRSNQRLRRVALIEDRERIARDLHDAVIQDLFAVGLSLQGMAVTSADPRTSAQLDEAVDRIDQVIGSLRSFIFDLRNLEAAKSDPARALRRMAERLAAPRGIEIVTQVEDLGDLPPERLDDLLLIAREAIFNAVKHAHARKLELDVSRSGQMLYLNVTDDGLGFDPETAKRGMGIGNMRDRAERSGGSLEIKPSASGGTSVIAELRLDA